MTLRCHWLNSPVCSALSSFSFPHLFLLVNVIGIACHSRLQILRMRPREAAREEALQTILGLRSHQSHEILIIKQWTNLVKIQSANS